MATFSSLTPRDTASVLQSADYVDGSFEDRHHEESGFLSGLYGFFGGASTRPPQNIGIEQWDPIEEPTKDLSATNCYFLLLRCSIGLPFVCLPYAASVLGIGAYILLNISCAILCFLVLQLIVRSTSMLSPFRTQTTEPHGLETLLAASFGPKAPKVLMGAAAIEMFIMFCVSFIVLGDVAEQIFSRNSSIPIPRFVSLLVFASGLVLPLCMPRPTTGRGILSFISSFAIIMICVASGVIVSLDAQAQIEREIALPPCYFNISTVREAWLDRFHHISWVGDITATRTGGSFWISPTRKAISFGDAVLCTSIVFAAFSGVLWNVLPLLARHKVPYASDDAAFGEQSASSSSWFSMFRRSRKDRDIAHGHPVPSARSTPPCEVAPRFLRVVAVPCMLTLLLIYCTIPPVLYFLTLYDSQAWNPSDCVGPHSNLLLNVSSSPSCPLWLLIGIAIAICFVPPIIIQPILQASEQYLVQRWTRRRFGDSFGALDRLNPSGEATLENTSDASSGRAWSSRFLLALLFCLVAITLSGVVHHGEPILSVAGMLSVLAISLQLPLLVFLPAMAYVRLVAPYGQGPLAVPPSGLPLSMQGEPGARPGSRIMRLLSLPTSQSPRFLRAAPHRSSALMLDPLARRPPRKFAWIAMAICILTVLICLAGLAGLGFAIYDQITMQLCVTRPYDSCTPTPFRREGDE